MNWRATVVWVLLIMSLGNALMKFWGNWLVFFAAVGSQAYFVFAGIYPYLFKKTILAFPIGGADIKFNPDQADTQTLWLRRFAVLTYAILYALIFWVS